jgi:CHAD domain-containing protein
VAVGAGVIRKMKKEKKLWDSKKSPAANAGVALPRLAAEFFESGRKTAATEAESYEELHRFRLSVKRFRYTMEAFRPLYGPGLDQRIARLRTVQQLLGSVNDCAATRRMLKRRQDAETEEIRHVLKFIDSRIAAKARKFKQFWIEDFDATGEELSWKNYLARQAGRKASRMTTAG